MSTLCTFYSVDGWTKVIGEALYVDAVEGEGSRNADSWMKQSKACAQRGSKEPAYDRQASSSVQKHPRSQTVQA